MDLVIASCSVLAHRKRHLSPPKRLAGQVAGLRFWRPLNVGGDFAWFRQHPTRRALYPRLRPAFRRWAYYAVWEDEGAFDEFLTNSPLGRAWAEEALEAWHVRLAPVRLRGEWDGFRPLRGAESQGRAGAPTAHIVRLDLSLRGTAAMWGSAAPNLLHHVPDSDDLLAGIPLVDRPYMQPVSFTVWRSEDAAHRFAHADGHRAAVSRVQRSQADLLKHYSAGRFDAYGSQGTWNGRDPLAHASDAANAVANPSQQSRPRS